VAVTLGFGERAIHIEDQGFEFFHVPTIARRVKGFQSVFLKPSIRLDLISDD
jgi:hypothetical protein